MFKCVLLVISFIPTSIIFLFYGSVIYGSFVKIWGVDNSLTFSHYITGFEESLGSLADSLLLAVIATPIAGLFGMMIAYLVVRKKFFGKNFVEIVSMMTFAVPGTVVGIGYTLAFNGKPFFLSGTALIIILLFI